MSSKRSVTKCFAALAVLLLSAHAFAKDTKKKADDSDDKKGGGMMEDSGKDPAATETTDDEGQFVPGKKKHQQASDEEGGDEEESAESEAIRKANPKQPEAAPKEVTPERKYTAKKSVGFFVEGLIGFGKVPYPGNQEPNILSGATAFALQVGGFYDLSTAFRLQLRVPYTLASYSFNDQSVSENALGVPELAGRLRLTQPGATEWSVRLGVGIPIAQGGDLSNNADVNGQSQEFVQYAANAANGYHDPELYMSKRLPISPALLYTHRANQLRLTGELKALIAPNIGGSIAVPSQTGGTYERPGVAVDTMLALSASYEIFTHGFAALSAWGVYQFSRNVDFNSAANGPSNFQFVLEPKFLMQFGHFVPSVGFVLPIAGELGGNMYGIRIHVDAVF